jgi:hypothetical protein
MTAFAGVERRAPHLLKRSERVTASLNESQHVGSCFWLPVAPRRERGHPMAITITEDFMTLETDGRPAATAIRQPDGRWQVTD